jgi:hypothetical protein
VNCPRFINFNPANHTFWINAQDTMGAKVNGTYIYKIDLKNKAAGSITRSTLTIKIS